MPPEILFHGTATRFVASIRKEGLRRGTRLYVHLSPDEPPAISVGKRHGNPVVLTVQNTSSFPGRRDLDMPTFFVFVVSGGCFHGQKTNP